MKSARITLYSGLAFIDQEYISVKQNGSGLDLADYDLQMQILDADNNYAVLAVPTVTKDAETAGRVWPVFTAAQTTALLGKNANWVLLMRPSDLSQDPRLVGYGPVTTLQGASWQA